ncbi:hypothetical protein HAX54_018191 [Datura stramonium]|uniref:Uncharacterized protein n=1 Tax=Datura stramonium TaxID=4076 RepID=A0ABS8UP37_DATST|nr:hypothetical protein [Datura stramonium]
MGEENKTITETHNTKRSSRGSLEGKLEFFNKSVVSVLMKGRVDKVLFLFLGFGGEVAEEKGGAGGEVYRSQSGDEMRESQILRSACAHRKGNTDEAAQDFAGMTNREYSRTFFNYSLVGFDPDDHEPISEMGLPHVLAQAHFFMWRTYFSDLPSCGFNKKWGISGTVSGIFYRMIREGREFKDLDIQGRSESFFLCKYVESLVLLDGSNGATTDPSIASESEEATELQPEL